MEVVVVVGVKVRREHDVEDPALVHLLSDVVENLSFVGGWAAGVVLPITLERVVCAVNSDEFPEVDGVSVGVLAEAR